MWTFLLVAVAVILATPACVLGVECLLALVPLRRLRSETEHDASHSRVVLVPAHNEQSQIGPTVNAIHKQLRSDDRLIVIADNCVDATAEIARAEGATTWEREDATNRGKGFAIRFALKRLADNPPDVVVCIDADCVPAAGCIDQITSVALETNRPVQAAYCMYTPHGAGDATFVSAFAVLVKNYVRLRGLQRAGAPCLITGSGVAYPWRALERVPHPDAHIVEDMAYSIDLALAGFPPAPCVQARVESPLPSAKESAATQRTRWEHGHLSVMLSQGPKLLFGIARRPSLSLIAMLLDLAVPPLSMLVGSITAGLVVFLAVGMLAGVWAPFYVLITAAALGGVGLTCAWLRFGRSVLPAKMLWRIPIYLASKAPIYWNFLFNRQRAWVRTGRSETAPPAETLAGAHFDSSREAAPRHASKSLTE